MLRAENLVKTFSASGGREIAAVKGASFEVGDGEVFGLLGPNGAGKTTLLRMLATIISPTSGYCWVNGVRADLARDEIRRHVGFLSGNTRLYGRLTVAELLQFFGRLYGMSEADISMRTQEVSALLGMDEFVGRRCDSLSTGQTQKVSIGRVILHDPQVLILDEPTLGLDVMTSRAILDFIVDARRRGRSIIFSTHYMSEAELLCDRVALIYKGSLMAIDTLPELFGRTGARNLQDAFLRMVDEQDAVAQ